jgi:lipoprotein-releasing system ATP-binding protein
MSKSFELVDIHRCFKQGGALLPVLQGADLTLEPGEVVALLGPSGSGKSSLLHIAGLLEKPDSGQVVIDGAPVSLDDENQRTRLRRQHIGFVYQFHNLLPEFTAAENVAMPARLVGVSRSDALDRASLLLGSLNLQDRLTHLPAQLSGGEQQRVALARALMNRPKVVLADEPTGSLDSKAGGQVAELMLELARAQKAAVLLATHDLNLAEQADRIVRMADGKIQAN